MPVKSALSYRLRWSATVAVGVLFAAASVAGAAPVAFDSGGNGPALSCLRDAARAEHHGRYSQAIAFETKALDLMPNFGDAFEARAETYMQAGLYEQAAADLDRVAAMRPTSTEITIIRAKMALRQGRSAETLASLRKALASPMVWTERHPYDGTSAGIYQGGNSQTYSANDYTMSTILAYASIAAQMQHLDDASLNYMSNMMTIEREHPEYILSNYCYEAAIAGLLDSAELACQQSIEANAHDIGQYDSMGFVYLRMKNWDKAIEFYNTSIDKRPDMTLSLYGRGIARRAKGDIAGGNADIAAATRDEPDIANIMKRLGAPTA